MPIDAVPPHPFKDSLPTPLYWAYRGLRTFTVALCFAGFWACVVLVGWLMIPFVVLWPGTRVARIRRVHRVMRAGFCVFHFAMRALWLYRRTSPVKTLRPGRSPVVLVANHPTLCDVTSIASLFPDVVAVARPGFAANPLLGRLVRLSGFVPTGPHVMRECEERLRMGFDVLVFPEGTRSPRGGSLYPFHRGAFELAARARVPIVLLKLTCSPPALSKGLPIWKVSDRMATLTIEPIDVIQPADTGLESRTMCRAIEQLYRDLFGYPALAAGGGEPQPLGDLQ
jgi:1-acyl-sn-glycerol-3-phosphate acyltransferase